MENITINVIVGLVSFIVAAIIFSLLSYYIIDRKNKKAQKDSKKILNDALEKAEEIKEIAKDKADALISKANVDSENIISKATLEANNITSKAQIDADEKISKAKNESESIRQQAKQDGENAIKAKRDELNELEDSLTTRENLLEKREVAITDKETNINALKEENEKKQAELASLEVTLKEKETKVDDELSRIASLSKEAAKKELMIKIEQESSTEIALFLKEKQEEAEDKAEENAKNILCGAIERYSQEIATERTVTTVVLPNDDMKGRIIGREGRNIKSLESILGCDIVIDDTPEVLTVSSFNPIRREIAVRTLEALIKDGRIQPGKIEEIYEKVKASIEEEIRKAGEETVMFLGLPKINKEFCKYIGKLKYRTSFGQNALDHCVQVSLLCGMMAAELGLDQTMAKRCGLLHDIGKSADFEMEGSHVEIGVRLAKKYGEPDEVISAIASHHGDVEKKYLTDELVVAADTLSAARPGARSETLENYIQRLEELENICKSYESVQNCYALQSGRDLRVMVIPDKITDSGCIVLAKEIKDRIQNEMVYPGNIKVTIIRETRAIETAK